MMILMSLAWDGQESNTTPVITVAQSTFLGVITSLVQSSGTCFSSHTAVNRGCKIFAKSSGSALNNSAFRLSSPRPLPFSGS